MTRFIYFIFDNNMFLFDKFIIKNLYNILLYNFIRDIKHIIKYYIYSFINISLYIHIKII